MKTKIRNSVLAIAMSPVCFAAAPAWAVDPVHEGALSVPANRIVGLWSSQAAISPCGSGQTPPLQRINTLVFNAGGTVVENPIGSPEFNQRSMGLGIWSFNPLTAQYTLHLRFDWFVDGAYSGYQVVDRTILLSNDGQQASGPVHSTRYTAAGSVIVEVCGDAVSQRL